jgi:hypothetical protein
VLPNHLVDIRSVHLRVRHLNLGVVVVQEHLVDAVDPAQVGYDSKVKLPVERKGVAADNDRAGDELVWVIGSFLTRVIEEGIGTGVDGRVI